MTTKRTTIRWGGRGLGMGLAALGWLLVSGATARAAPGVGDPAPDFSLMGSDGRLHSLSDHRGGQGVVLAWFPKAFTPGWTAELESLRDSEKALRQFDVAYYMVSLDSEEKNRAFAEALNANFPVLSDPGKQVARAYGVVGITGFFAKRWTFYIDAKGVIRRVQKEVDPASHGAQVARNLGELGFPRAGSPGHLAPASGGERKQ